METLNHIFQNFNEYLIVGLLVVLFFKESVMSFVNSKLGIKTSIDTPDWALKTQTEMERLSEYTNHSTTEKLNTLIEMHSRHIRMEELEHEKFDDLRDNLTNMGRDIKEIKEYGIKIRQ